MEKIITNLPIKPQTDIKTGLYLTPLLLETIAKLTNSKSTLMLNLLHSFKDYSINKNNFVNGLQKKGISFDKIDCDIENIEEYKRIIKDLYKLHILKPIEYVNCSCECKRVEIRKDRLQNIKNKKLIEEVNGEYQCSCCKSKLIESKENGLILNCQNIQSYSIPIYPQNLQNHIKKNMNSTDLELLISKSRNTGVSITLDNVNYNIDIDFLLYLTPQLFENNDITIVTCNRHVVHTQITNYINSVYGHKNLTFIEHPYIISKNENSSYPILADICDNNLFKATLLNTISWNNPDSLWDENKFTYLKKHKEYLDESLKSYETIDGSSDLLKPRNVLTDYCKIIEKINNYKHNQME